MADAAIVSHGRGGQGNIHSDHTPYADAGIVRKGPEGDQGDGAYSAGRGGAGNIGSPHARPKSTQPHDADVVPEMAIRPSQDGDHHTGRGGQGNIEKVKSNETPVPPTTTTTTTTMPKVPEKSVGNDVPASSIRAPQGLADLLKEKIFGRK